MVKEIEDQSGEVGRKREGGVGGVTALPSWTISQDLGKSLGLQEAVLYGLGPQCVSVCSVVWLPEQILICCHLLMPDPQAKDTKQERQCLRVGVGWGNSRKD